LAAGAYRTLGLATLICRAVGKFDAIATASFRFIVARHVSGVLQVAFQSN
jgi:hypothetical protein